MPATRAEPERLQFGVYELDLVSGELRKSGVLIHLPPQPFKILALLAGRAGQLVTREEIQKEVWGGDTFVDFEHGLNFAIKRIREALSDDALHPRYIETLPRRGYRFIAPVETAQRGVSEEETLQRTVSTPPPEAVAPVDVGAHGVRPDIGASGTRRVPLRRRLALAGVGLAAIVAALLALNVGGLRDWVLTAVGAHGVRPDVGAMGTRRVPLPKIESIAVLPLENLSRDPEQEYFADGMTEALITDLGKISALRVISRTSVMTYKGKRKALPEIARELNVDAIVEGSVQRSGDRVRITANLLHGPTDRHLWADTYESDLGDVLVLQDEVARAIASEIQIKVTPNEQVRLASARPVNPESYRLYLQGRYHLYQDTRDATEKSISLFQQAIEKDPDNALAWAGLAYSYGNVAIHYSTSPKEWFGKAKAAALKALEIDSSLAEAHTALGFVRLRWDWDWQAAERELKRGVELKPNDAYVHWRYSDYLTLTGRHEQAISEIRRAQELDPLSPRMLAEGCVIYRNAHRYDESIEQCEKALELDPNNGGAHDELGLTYIVKGMATEAATEFETGRRLGALGSGPSIDAFVYAAGGRRGEAQKLRARVVEYAKRGEMTPFAVAQFYVGLGDNEKALDWLEKAYDLRDPFMITLKGNVFFDPLRSEPRFQALLRRMNFPP